MTWIVAFALLAGADLLGRAITLLYLMQHSAVRRLSFRTWVLLVAFLNFAFLLYWLLGRGTQAAISQQENTSMR